MNENAVNLGEDNLGDRLRILNSQPVHFFQVFSGAGRSRAGQGRAGRTVHFSTTSGTFLYISSGGAGRDGAEWPVQCSKTCKNVPSDETRQGGTGRRGAVWGGAGVIFSKT